MKNAADVLIEAAELYKQRNAVYGDNFLRQGKVMAEIFPDGINLKTKEDFTRFHLLDWMIGKITRMTFNFKNGHDDSEYDLIVYAAMYYSEGKKNREKKNV